MCCRPSFAELHYRRSFSPLDVVSSPTGCLDRDRIGQYGGPARSLSIEEGSTSLHGNNFSSRPEETPQAPGQEKEKTDLHVLWQWGSAASGLRGLQGPQDSSKSDRPRRSDLASPSNGNICSVSTSSSNGRSACPIHWIAAVCR